LYDLVLHKKYRSHFEIMALILDAVQNGSEDKYSLMKCAGLNYSQLKKYLGPLAEIGLIIKLTREGRVLYRTSEKGLAILRQYYILLEMLMDVQTPGIADGIRQIEPNGRVGLQPILQRLR
jgi:predicted transcriptional regulator